MDFKDILKNHKHHEVPWSTAVISLSVVALIAVIVPLLIFAQEFIPEANPNFQKAAQIDGTPVDEGTDEEEHPQDRMDPKEISNAIRELKNTSSEIKRLAKQAKKLKGPEKNTIIEELNALQVEANKFLADVKNPPADSDVSEVIRDFWDARFWDALNPIRSKIEMPRELSDIDRDLKQLEKWATKSSKSIALPGINVEAFKTNVAQIRQSWTDAKQSLAAGDYDEANNAMQEIHQGKHPGNVLGFFGMYREINRMGLKRIKDPIMKNLVLEILDPIILDFNNGEFEDARQAMEDFGREMEKMSRKYKFDSRDLSDNPAVTDKLNKLEELIRQRLEGAGENQQNEENED